MNFQVNYLERLKSSLKIRRTNDFYLIHYQNSSKSTPREEILSKNSFSSSSLFYEKIVIAIEGSLLLI